MPRHRTARPRVRNRPRALHIRVITSVSAQRRLICSHRPHRATPDDGLSTCPKRQVIQVIFRATQEKLFLELLKKRITTVLFRTKTSSSLFRANQGKIKTDLLRSTTWWTVNHSIIIYLCIYFYQSIYIIYACMHPSIYLQSNRICISRRSQTIQILVFILNCFRPHISQNCARSKLFLQSQGIRLRQSWQYLHVYTGWPRNNGTVDTVNFSGLCSNQQLFSSLCWIEHLFPIIITPRSSNLVENFLFYETFLMDCHFRDLPDFQSFEARWQINGKSQKWQSIRNYS